MEFDVHTILRRPILTEKSTVLIDRDRKYVFEVIPAANKLMIRSAVEAIFDVEVDKVNVRVRKGKRKRVGRSVGFGKDRKEAIVTLKPGHTIDVY